MQVQVSNVGSTIVKLNLTHSVLKIRVPEVRFDLFETIGLIKDLCEKRFGTSTANMQLVLRDTNGNTVATMNEDDRTLGFYCPHDDYDIHCIDLDPNSITRDLDDLSQVEKYKISEEDYDKLPDTFRKFYANLIKNNPSLGKPKEEKNEAYMAGEASSFTVGKRCRLLDSGHRGEIKYVGMIPELGEGWWIGIQLDEPFGKNDGSAKGVKYFSCPQDYGLFVRPPKAEMGDFPELGLDDEDDEI